MQPEYLEEESSGEERRRLAEDGGSDTQLLRACVALPEAMDSWRVLNVALHTPNYSDAIAIERIAPRVVQWKMETTDLGRWISNV